MEYKDDKMELSEEDLMNVHSVPEVLLDRPDEFEKVFGNRGKKELETIKEILEAEKKINLEVEEVGDKITSKC